MIGIVSIALMSVDHRTSHIESLRSFLSAVVYPVRAMVNMPFDAGTWVSEGLTSRTELIAENRRLRHQALIIESRLGKYAQLEAENRRLRALLDSSAKVAERVLVAELLNVGSDPFSRLIVLNKGRRHGVFSGQSLIDAHGVMGQIVNVGPFSSTALLITDPSHALPVRVRRNGYRSVAAGRGSINELELLHVPNNAELEVGDTVLTSGLGGRFPVGYPVGRIVSVERNTAHPFATVRVKPSARLERNLEVLLVRPGDLANLDESQTGDDEIH